MLKGRKAATQLDPLKELFSVTGPKNFLSLTFKRFPQRSDFFKTQFFPQSVISHTNKAQHEKL
jgi:hypothetical protein